MIGQSGAGKSTLAAAIGAGLDLPVTHLDQLRHLPGTQWELRPDDEFAALHANAVCVDRWVIEGNYSLLWTERFERASGLILLDLSTPRSLVEYLRRTGGRGPRIGGLDGTTDVLSRQMVAFIVRRTRANRRRRRDLFDSVDLPKLLLSGRPALRDFYEQEGLRRPLG